LYDNSWQKAITEQREAIETIVTQQITGVAFKDLLEFDVTLYIP
jgi:hypothetical protein